MPFKYYSSLAKTVHVWRGSHRDIYSAWVRQFGAESANKEAKTMIPRCLTGRWGSIFATQARLLRAGRTRLPSALTEALGQKQKDETRTAAPVSRFVNRNLAQFTSAM